MDVSQQDSPNDWVTLEHLGEEIAQATIVPEGEKFLLVIRVLRNRLEMGELSERLTLENLLNASGIRKDEVESWQIEGVSPENMEGDHLGLRHPLPLPPQDATHLTLYVRLNPQEQEATDNEAGEQEASGQEASEGGVGDLEAGELEVSEQEVGEGAVTLEKWQALEACWKAILGLEASIDSSRLSSDGLRIEMESAFKRPMSIEEKVHALQSDVAQWNKAKNRVHYALPKVREFIHRATWALAIPERKRLEEIFKSHIEPRIPLPQPEKVLQQMEHLQKERQILFAVGTGVSQECRGIIGEIQRAASTMQRNAADNARRKRDAKRSKK